MFPVMRILLYNMCYIYSHIQLVYSHKHNQLNYDYVLNPVIRFLCLRHNNKVPMQTFCSRENIGTDGA